MKHWELHRLVDVVCSYSAMINRGRVRDRKTPLHFAGIDLAAGLGAYGYQPQRGRRQALVGSPLQLLEAVVRHGLSYRLGLFERDTDVLPLLRQNLANAIKHLGADSDRIEVVPGDFTTTAENWIRRNVRQWMIGLLIVDVNAVFDSPQLLRIAQRPELKMVDVALHIPATMLKWPERRIPPSTLEQLKGSFNKQFWQVAPSRGNYQWTWLYATNNPRMRELSERGFVAIDSPIGKARVHRLSTTTPERLRLLQSELFEPVLDL